MNEQLPDHLLDYQLETQHGKDWRHITHTIQDPDQPPTTPNRIEVWKTAKRPIGRGGQGQVFLQSCISGARHYDRRALKLIPCESQGGKQLYVRELEAMVKFSHEKYSRYFVRMLGWYLTSEHVSIAMEYLPAGDLQTYLREHPPLLEEESRTVINQVLQGLTFMHRGGFAHRDIKPQNVLIERHPQVDEEPFNPLSWWVKLADFGITKRLSTALTVVGGPVGTLDYMAPELLGSFDREVDVDYLAADMWSTGAMMHQMVTGLQGFRRRRLEFDETSDATAFVPGECNIGSEGLDFLLKLTLRDPSQRLKTADVGHHHWMESLRPEDPAGSSADSLASAVSSSSSSARSSLFSGGVTTLATRLTDTYIHDESEVATLATRLTETQVGTEPETSPQKTAIPEYITTPGATNEAIATRIVSEALDSQIEINIHTAAAEGHLSVVQRLVEQGTDPDTLGENGSRPLFSASVAGHLKVVEYLISQGADILARNQSGWTAVCAAASMGFLKIVEVLASRGADLTVPNTDGWAPLHLASKFGFLEIVKVLVNHGVDFTVPNNEGLSPMALANAFGRPTVVKFLNDRQTISLISSPNFTPIVADCAHMPYWPIPSTLANYTSWRPNTGAIGDAKNPKLYAFSMWQGFAGKRFCWILHNGPKENQALAAGGEIVRGLQSGEIMNGLQFRSLDSIIHVPALPGTEEAQRGSAATIVLQASLASDEQTVIYHFSVDQMSASGAKASAFEWRRVSNPSSGYLKEFILYRLQGHSSQPQSPGNSLGSPLATFTIKSRFSSSNSFNWHLLHPVDARTALIVLSSALSIWKFQISQIFTNRALREFYGYDNINTEDTSSE